MARTIIISQDQQWRVKVRRGFIGPVALVSHSGVTKRIFTSVFTIPRAVRYARQEAAKAGATVRA